MTSRLLIYRVLAWLLIVLEAGIFAFWHLFFWTLFFLALWMFNIPALGGIAGSIFISVLFFAGFLYFLIKGAARFQCPPTRNAAFFIDRRIEFDSNIPHRPLTSLKDRHSTPLTQQQRDLWRRENIRRKKAIQKIKWPVYHPQLSGKDPYGIRLFILLFFIGGLMVAGPEWKSRAYEGILPPVQFGEQGAASRHFAAIITPPDYTNLTQAVIDGPGTLKDTLKIPAGSSLKINLQSGLGAPSLYHGETATPFEKIGPKSYSIEIPMPEKDPQHIKVGQFWRTVFSMDYDIIPDAPPTIHMQSNERNKEDTENTVLVLQNGQIQVPLMVQDDYGVQTLSMTMELDPEIKGNPIGWPVEQSRSILSPPGENYAINPVYDFTANPWAGLPAVLHFTAYDALGQNANLPPIKITLPERIFRHPVSQKLADLRKQLGQKPILSVQNVRRNLENILIYPQSYGDDLVVFLALRSAISRLYYSGLTQSAPYPDTQAVMALLWDTALRIEDGNLSMAARNLRAAQQNLEQALQEDAIGKEEIAKLMYDLRQAMAEYLFELQKELQKQFSQSDGNMMASPDMLSSMMNMDGLAGFLEQMEQEMRNGDPNAAKKMLSQLQNMLDTLNPNVAGAMPEDMQAMAESLRGLQEIVKRQQDLLDQTKLRSQSLADLMARQKSYGQILKLIPDLEDKLAENGFPPPPYADPDFSAQDALNLRKEKVEQEAIRSQLGELMLKMSNTLQTIPEPIQKAEQEMRKSTLALEDNQPENAIKPQQKALEHLQQGQETVQNQLQKRLKQMAGNALMFGFGQTQYDPLGRPLGKRGGQSLFPGSDIKIPEESEQKKVQEILQILRKRSSDLNRPEQELEYFRRLLRQF